MPGWKVRLLFWALRHRKALFVLSKITKSVVFRQDGYFTFSDGRPFNPEDMRFINKIKPNRNFKIDLYDQDEEGRFRRISGSVSGG